MTTPITTPTGNPSIDAAIAAAETLLPSIDPRFAIADVLLRDGLAFWANFQAQKMSGKLTMDDLEKAAATVNVDLSTFAQHIKDAQAREAKAASAPK